jgi:predicted nuclease of restriction endonuclease-like (RecB) superfamily
MDEDGFIAVSQQRFFVYIAAVSMKPVSTQLFSDVKAILSQGRQKAYSAVNTAMVEAYWLIGKRIVEEEQKGSERAEYGDMLIKELSKSLTDEFRRGFSVTNIKSFRLFYLIFPDFQIGQTLSALLTWSHYQLIMRVKDENARIYYIRECAEHQWSVRTLERHITTHYFQRVIASQEPPDSLPVVSGKEQQRPQDIIKDPYVFEFLNIPQPHSFNEKTIEAALINHLQEFLLELGKGFSFVGRQHRVSTETSHFYIDLVFYNYILKCFVLFDIKTGKLSHQDMGQMDMYVRLFDELRRSDNDQPTIGVILCTEKDETVVKYSVLKESQQLFATKYLPYLPSEQELKAEIEQQKALFQRQHEAEE